MHTHPLPDGIIGFSQHIYIGREGGVARQNHKLPVCQRGEEEGGEEEEGCHAEPPVTACTYIRKSITTSPE